MPIRILEFYKESQISVVLKCARYTFLAMFGDREAELVARDLQKQCHIQYSHPAMRLLFDALEVRLNHHEWHQKRLYPYLKNVRSQGLPFDEDKQDPAVITQIKKIINILKLGEDVLCTIEKMGDENALSRLFTDVNLLETTDKVYTLCKLLMWPDINLLSEFKEEFDVLQMLFEPMCAVLLDPTAMEMLLQQGMDFKDKLGHRLGHETGKIASAYEKPLNFQSLMQLKSMLPEVLQQWTTSIQVITQKQVPKGRVQHAPYSLEAKLGAFLSPIEALSRKSLLNPSMMLDLTRTLKHGHRLVWALCHEMNQFEAPNQARIRALLKQFKLEFCLPLLCFLDKCEEKLILTPGGLVNPIQAHLEHLFDAVTQALKRFISLNDEERTLVNSEMMTKRLDALYERRAKLRMLCTHNENRAYLLTINEDILNNVYQMRRIFHSTSLPQCVLSEFSTKKMPDDELHRQYVHYLKQHEMFLQAKKAYERFIHMPENDSVHYANQRKRFLYHVFKPILPHSSWVLHDVVANPRDIAQRVAVLEKQFNEGLAYYQAHWVNPDVQSEAVLSPFQKTLTEMTNIVVERCQSLNDMFNEDVQAALKPVEDDFLTRLRNIATNSINQLPYPDITDPKTALSQPQSILWIKRLANAGTHLSQALRQCDLFDTTKAHHTGETWDLKSQYIKAVSLMRMGVVEHHARNAMWTVLDLAQDNYLYDFYQQRVEQMKKLSGAAKHVISAQEIKQVKAMVAEASTLFEKLHPQTKLFLHLPQIFDLFVKLNDLMQAGQSQKPTIILQKLAKIESILTMILIEADLCEEHLLFKRGLMTTPLEQILAHYHQSFVKSHPFLSEADLKMTAQRLKALQQRVDEKAHSIHALRQQKKQMRLALEALNVVADPVSLATRQQIIHHLKAASARCQVAYRQCATPEELAEVFDATYSSGVNDALLKQLMEIYLAHLEGVIQGQSLVTRAMAEKKVYLLKKMKTEQSRKTWVEQVPESFPEVQEAIIQFKRYLTAQSIELQRRPVTRVYESHETLRKKVAYINELESLIENKKMPHAVRLNQLKFIVEKESFKKTMLAYHRYDFFSFRWLWQCLWRLFTALSIYIPPFQKAYASLSQALVGSASTRYGFFVEPETSVQREGSPVLAMENPSR